VNDLAGEQWLERRPSGRLFVSSDLIDALAFEPCIDVGWCESDFRAGDFDERNPSLGNQSPYESFGQSGVNCRLWNVN